MHAADVAFLTVEPGVAVVFGSVFSGAVVSVAVVFASSDIPPLMTEQRSVLIQTVRFGSKCFIFKYTVLFMKKQRFDVFVFYS